MKRRNNDRAVRWLLNGLLLCFFIPMAIPASDDKVLVADRFFQILPIFLSLLALRILCGQRKGDEDGESRDLRRRKCSNRRYLGDRR